MNEADTRANHIDPALKAAGWGEVEGSVIRREYKITLGRIQGQGKRANGLTADYVLSYRNTKLAVVEAKALNQPLTEGVAQAKDYAGKLAVRFAYSSNGLGIYGIDMQTGQEGETPAYPTPQELWDRTFAEANAWRDRFAAIPYEDKSGSHPGRYYQETAVERALAAVADGQKRILLTLATGTGKTFIAFQIAWKLFQSRWSLTGEPTRRPRILFLADRNILANQAYNSFSAFPEDALVRISPDIIRKKGRVPKNGNIFFTIFQTFMSGPNDSPNFGDYPPDFFDFIIIDECHRGGANDEGNWRKILDYFAPAVQLGLTATPKRKDNVDTYEYFGKPVYTYSLKDGINDGFLTPFKVNQISTTIDEYQYTPDDTVVEGEVESDKVYEESDFNRVIEIMEREEFRVKQLLAMIGPNEKTIVFCANQAHALAVRDLINKHKRNSDPNYCHRVTAHDGALGEQYLRNFQDNERTIPTVLTTSQKLSTGVDARNVRNIVLLRPVRSMIEFKQIVGRGTRLYDGKDYFTIFDFVKAYKHFNDPEWDGEPLDPVPPNPREPGGSGEPREPVEEGEGETPPARPVLIKIKLADGKERTFQSMSATSFWHPDGTPISAAQFLELLYGDLPKFFQSEAQLRELWSNPDTRKKLLEGLEEKGFDGRQLRQFQSAISADDSDLYDVLAFIAYARAPETRDARAKRALRSYGETKSERERAFLDFVLGQYVDAGFEELDPGKLGTLVKLKYGTAHDAAAQLGSIADIRKLFHEVQPHLYVD